MPALHSIHHYHLKQVCAYPQDNSASHGSLHPSQFLLSPHHTFPSEDESCLNIHPRHLNTALSVWSVQQEGCNIKIQLVTSDAMCVCVFPGQCWWLSHHGVSAVCYSAEFWARGRSDDWSFWLPVSIYFHTPNSRRWTPAHIMRSGTSIGLFWCYFGRDVEPIYKDLEVVLKFLSAKTSANVLLLKIKPMFHGFPLSACVAVSTTSAAFTSFVFFTLPCAVFFLAFHPFVSNCSVFHSWLVCLLDPPVFHGTFVQSYFSELVLTFVYCYAWLLYIVIIDSSLVLPSHDYQYFLPLLWPLLHWLWFFARIKHAFTHVHPVSHSHMLLWTPSLKVTATQCESCKAPWVNDRKWWYCSSREIASLATLKLPHHPWVTWRGLMLPV